VIVDIFTHIYPNAYYEAVCKAAPQLENLGKRMRTVAKLHDLDERIREMDAYGDYRQIISLPVPPIDDVAGPKLAPTLACIANDTMAELCARHPDRFPAFVAAVSMHDVEAALEELHRAIGTLGARGIQLYTNVAGRPLDDAAFLPVFDAMAALDLPIWLHPMRTSDATDYGAEDKSRYELWWCYGWPYDTSVAMTRLVFAGLFDRHPNIKIVTHHLGGMIPYFEGRAVAGLQVLGSRTTDEDYSGVLSGLKKPHSAYFRMFYGDTAMFGGFHGTKCGIEYFGADHVVFATDAPMASIPETLQVIDRLELAADDLACICAGNAAKLMNMTFS
jgi:aminocarboxymuconate-semialdehyde decarboxylase